MGLIETEAIVLRTYTLSEADKIVVCLTRSSGVVRAVARGARRLKSRFGAGLEPFTIIALTYYEKEGRELVSVRHTEIIRSFFSLANNADTVAALAYMSELVMEFAPPHEPNEKVFRMIRAVLEALGHEPEDISALVRYFEIWMLKLAGFLPDLRSCAECGLTFDEAAMSYLNAEYVLRCGRCSRSVGKAFSQGAHAQVRAAQRLSPAEFASAARDLAEAQRREVTSLTQGLIGRALDRQPRGQATFI